MKLTKIKKKLLIGHMGWYIVTVLIAALFAKFEGKILLMFIAVYSSIHLAGFVYEWRFRNEI